MTYIVQAYTTYNCYICDMYVSYPASPGVKTPSSLSRKKDSQITIKTTNNKRVNCQNTTDVLAGALILVRKKGV